MSQWEMVKLGSIYKISSGGTPLKSHSEYYEDGNIPWVKTGNLKGKYVSTSIDVISELGLKNSSAKLFPKGTVLIAMYGATIGACSILDFEACTNQACGAFLPNNDMDVNYLFYFLGSKKEDFIKMGVGGAQPNISATILKEVKIPLPPIEIQQKIAKILDAASDLLKLRKQQLAELDILVKSQFVEMFGGNKYPIVKVEEICEFITKGTTPQTNEIVEECNEGYIPYLKVYNLSYDGTMLFDKKPQYIKKEVHEGLLSRSKVYPQDVLMNIVGPPLGKFALVPENFCEWNINQAIAIFRATEKVSSRYLLYALMQPETLRPFINSAVGIRQQNLSLLQCRNLEIPLPPFTLQTKFTTIVEKIEQQKSLVYQAIDETQTLFDSLMSRYFD